MFAIREFFYSTLPKERRSSDPLGSEDALLEHEEKSVDVESASEDGTSLYAGRAVEYNKGHLWTVFRYAHSIVTLLLGLTVVVGYTRIHNMKLMNPQVTYSPAQDIVRYVPKAFDSGFDFGKTIYQGPPSAKNNEAWEALFIHGLTRITAKEAAPMHNKTLPIPDDPEHYIVSLAVFHQLHCLNAIRFALWNQTMDEEKERLHHETDIRHLDHCVDNIRQAIMCAADISPFVWARDPRDGRAKGITSIEHTCRDWDSVAQWAADRPFKTGFNLTKVAENDPLGWSDHQLIMDYGEITDWGHQKQDYEDWERGKVHEQHLRGHVGYPDRTDYA
ncbi:MAG: hypothetical protein Q9160_002896 [Pyrenula sp. 1 TL-2023]